MSSEPATTVRRVRVRWYWWAAAVAAVLATAAGALFSVATIGAVQDMPRTLVAQYLTALEHGKAREAMALGGITARSQDMLLTDAAYAKATDKITSFTLAKPVSRGGVTTVDATVQQGRRPYHRSFRVERAGGLPWLPVWRLAPVAPDTLELELDDAGGAALVVAGLEPHTADSRITLHAFPGTYPVVVANADPEFTFRDGVVVSHPAGSTVAPTVFAAELTDAGRADAQKAVDTWLDKCLATQDASPADCPFVTGDETVGGVQVSDFHWTLDARPQATIDAKWANGGFAVSARGGLVEASATLTRISDGATASLTTPKIPFGYDGIVDFTEYGTVFRPSPGHGTSPGTSQG
jgi:hypothetical protein